MGSPSRAAEVETHRHLIISEIITTQRRYFLFVIKVNIVLSAVKNYPPRTGALQINWLDSILTTSPFVREEKRPKMAIFLVDLQFREKAKQVLSSREMFAVVLFLMFALLPWVEIMETAQVMTNSTWWDINAYTMDQSGGEGAGHCNPHTRACL